MAAAGECRTLFEQLKRFYRENRWVPWIAAFSVLLSYGLCLSGTRIGIDSEANLNDADAFLNSWYSIGRFSLVFTKNLFGLRQLNLWAANLLMIICMILYGIFADFLFCVFSGNDRRMKAFYIIFPALFLTHPCFVQQYIFTVQAFEVALGILICFVSVYCISRWVFEGAKGLLIPGVLCMVWSFGSYQAIVPLYMGAALAVYLVYYYFHDGKEKFFYTGAALRHLAAFLIGYVFYTLAVKAVIIWQKGFDFQGEYLEEQIYWLLRPVSQCIASIRHYIGEVILGRNIFYPMTFLLFALLFAAHLLWQWRKARRREYLLYAAASLALVLSPFYLSFYQGGGLLMRSQLNLPFTSAFFGAAAAVFIFSRRKYLAAAVTILCLICAARQGATASRALYSAQMTYENDKMTAGQLAACLQQIGAAAPGTRIAMIGQYHPALPGKDTIRDETVGYSFFEWDYMSDIGVSKRGTGFMKAIGFPYESATPEEYAAARMYSLTMPEWPAAGSVQKVGDIAVVKFSSEY